MLLSGWTPTRNCRPNPNPAAAMKTRTRAENTTSHRCGCMRRNVDGRYDAGLIIRRRFRKLRRVVVGVRCSRSVAKRGHERGEAADLAGGEGEAVPLDRGEFVEGRIGTHESGGRMRPRAQEEVPDLVRERAAEDAAERVVPEDRREQRVAH